MARPRDDTLAPRLIAAASRDFSTNGFAGVTMASLGALARVTKGGVYLHFKTKEDLFFAAVDHWRQAHRDLLAAAVSDGPEGEPVTLRSFLVQYLRFHFVHPEASGLMRVLASEMRGRFTTRLREDQQATLRSVRARVRELLMQGVHDGSLFTTDPALATFVLAATLEGVVSLVSSSPRDAEPFRHPESIVDFLLAPYEIGGAVTEEGSGPRERPDGVDFLPPF